MKFNKLLGLFIIILVLLTNFAVASKIPEFYNFENTIHNSQQKIGYTQTKFEISMIKDMHFVEKKEDDKEYDKYKMTHFKWYQFYYPIFYGIKYVIDSVIGLGGYVAIGVDAATSGTSDSDSMENSFKNKYKKMMEVSDNNTSIFDISSLTIRNDSAKSDCEKVRGGLNSHYPHDYFEIDEVFNENGTLNEIKPGDVIQYIIRNNTTYTKEFYKYLILDSKHDNVYTFIGCNISFRWNGKSDEPDGLYYDRNDAIVNINDDQFNNDNLKYYINCSKYCLDYIIYAYDSDSNSENSRDPTKLKEGFHHIPDAADNNLIEKCDSSHDLAIAGIAFGAITILAGIVAVICSFIPSGPGQVIGYISVIIGTVTNIANVFVNMMSATQIDNVASACTNIGNGILGFVGIGSILRESFGTEGLFKEEYENIDATAKSTTKVSLIISGIALLVSGGFGLASAIITYNSAEGLKSSLIEKNNDHTSYLEKLNNTIKIHNENPHPLTENELMMDNISINASKPKSTI
ncbi:MAG: hypothetical protein LBD03_06960 [Methanobrevibacter sp.]|jgi:hypothetical protein|nr:hypothetical protein [Candidatus Methanovirga procula]